jgi:hypothetical protein
MHTHLCSKYGIIVHRTARREVTPRHNRSRARTRVPITSGRTASTFADAREHVRVEQRARVVGAVDAAVDRAARVRVPVLGTTCYESARLLDERAAQARDDGELVALLRGERVARRVEQLDDAQRLARERREHRRGEHGARRVRKSRVDAGVEARVSARVVDVHELARGERRAHQTDVGRHCDLALRTIVDSESCVCVTHTVTRTSDTHRSPTRRHTHSSFVESSNRKSAHKSAPHSRRNASTLAAICAHVCHHTGPCSSGVLASSSRDMRRPSSLRLVVLRGVAAADAGGAGATVDGSVSGGMLPTNVPAPLRGDGVGSSGIGVSANSTNDANVLGIEKNGSATVVVASLPVSTNNESTCAAMSSSRRELAYPATAAPAAAARPADVELERSTGGARCLAGPVRQRRSAPESALSAPSSAGRGVARICCTDVASDSTFSSKYGDDSTASRLSEKYASAFARSTGALASVAKIHNEHTVFTVSSDDKCVSIASCTLLKSSRIAVSNNDQIRETGSISNATVEFKTPSNVRQSSGVQPVNEMVSSRPFDVLVAPIDANTDCK